jgi:lipopolysaccharide biosynthesis regulator YciM
VILQSQSLLQKKMALEQKWARSFLEEGRVTLECNEIDQEIKDLKRLMISNDEFIAHKTNTDAFSIAN